MTKEKLLEWKRKYMDYCVRFGQGKDTLLQDLQKGNIEEIVKKYSPYPNPNYINNTNKIYVKLGNWAKDDYYFDFSHGIHPKFEFLGINFPFADVTWYRDLENFHSMTIPLEQTEEFEQGKMIINLPFPCGSEPFVIDSMLFEMLEILRGWFFLNVLIKPQEEVVESLKNPETILNIFETYDYVKYSPIFRSSKRIRKKEN